VIVEEEPEQFAECPWCGNRIYVANDPHGPSKVCPECGLAQHESHWNENNGCAQMGCRLQAPVPQ
jgi:ribosomal protein S27AE